MKHFVKALDKNDAAFQHLPTVFPELLTSKGVSLSGLISEKCSRILISRHFLEKLRAWKAFKSASIGFVGDTRAPDHSLSNF